MRDFLAKVGAWFRQQWVEIRDHKSLTKELDEYHDHVMSNMTTLRDFIRDGNTLIDKTRREANFTIMDDISTMSVGIRGRTGNGEVLEWTFALEDGNPLEDDEFVTELLLLFG